ncbi:glycosyltransferase family 2 protein [Gammaproteobacteria bacterium]|nr:glycosyltransferase family 2 protein [Gammaproteobacteria bacterium]
MEISVIVPTKDFPDCVDQMLDALSKQSKLPAEVIIIDSSKDHCIDELLIGYKSVLNIQYHKYDQSLFPGEARNKGLELCKFATIAFLDSKTVPNRNWLESSSLALQQNQDIIFGSTLYTAKTRWQKIFQSSIYGKMPVETLPGSILSVVNAKKIGKFSEGIRAGEDEEWRNKAKECLKSWKQPNHPNLTYSSISTNLSQELYRNFIYQLHGARTDAQRNSKMFVFGVFITLLTLLTPSWNLLIGYKINILFIPNVTKIYLFTMISALTILFLFYREKMKAGVMKFLVTAIMIAGFYFVYRWNGAITSSMDSILYFPHITKIYLLLLAFSGFIFRGIISPLKKGLKLSEIMPFQWIIIGIACFVTDLAKVPGYFIGAILAIFKMLASQIQIQIKKINPSSNS